MQHAGRISADERDWYQRGRQHFDAGEDPQALDAFSRLLEGQPRYADVHYMVGLLHERNGRLEDAGRHLERAVQINPGYAECLLALASVYEQQGRFDRSRDATDRLRRLSVESQGGLDGTTRGKLANLQAAVGDAYREAGELREAIEAYRKSLDRAPHFHDIRQRLGVALREAGLPSQAIAEFKRVLRGNPRYLEAAVQLGLTWYTLGRSARAVEEWTAVLERDPSRDDARMYLRMVQGREASKEPST